MTEEFWAKNIVVEPRKCDIISAKVDKDPVDKIEQYTDKLTGVVTVDLDNSVFRNIKRLIRTNIRECMANDCRFWVVDRIIED